VTPRLEALGVGLLVLLLVVAFCVLLDLACIRVGAAVNAIRYGRARRKYSHEACRLACDEIRARELARRAKDDADEQRMWQQVMAFPGFAAERGASQ
jgi:hypothetical protein